MNTNANGNWISIMALVVAAVVGSMYITREVSKDKDVLKKIEEVDQLRVYYKHQVDSISSAVKQRDRILITQIDSAYRVIEKINSKRNATLSEINALDKTIEKLKEEREAFYKLIGK